MADKKVLSCAQAVDAAVMLLEINTKRDEVTTMLKHADLSQDAVQVHSIYLEWLAFIHAAIVYSLMHRAPASVVAAYLRTTTQLLQHHAPTEALSVQNFVDSVFSPYMECLAQERQKDCPTLFIQRVCKHSVPPTTPTTLRVISGVMAMALCSILDAVSQYDMQAD